MIPSKYSHLHVAVATHPGMKGKNNEDRYAVSAYSIGEEKRIPSVLAVVCDGIGGHRAGEVAAEIAVEKISLVVAQSDGSQPLATLREAISEANQAVRSQSEVDPTRKGMGATCACAWVIGDRLFIASVGDSRIYLERAGTIHKLTTDHTWIQEALDQGILTPEQARGHPNVHVIRRYLGSQQPVEADTRLKLSRDEDDVQAQSNQGLKLVPGDTLMLCSDGLTDLVEDTEIREALQKKRLEEALGDLINLANERGGHDNITTVGMKVPQAKSAPMAVPAPQARRKNPIPVLLISLGVVGALLVLAALGLAGFYFLQSRPTPTATQATLSPTVAPPSFTPSATVTSTGLSTGTVTPLAPPVIKVTITVLPGPSTPTYTPWPTNTGLHLGSSTGTTTPLSPKPGGD